MAAALLLLLPVASAAQEVHLRMTSEDGIRASADVASALFAAAYTEEPGTLQFSCPALRITSYESESAVAPLVEVATRRSSASFVVHDAEVSIAGQSPRAWLGVYPPERSIVTSLVGSSDIIANASVVIGNARSTPETTADHARPSFGIRIAEPVLLVDPASHATLHGPWTTKLSGLLLDVHSRENDTRIDTRERPAPSPGQNVRRWAVLACMQDGSIEGWTEPLVAFSWAGADATGLAAQASDIQINDNGAQRTLQDQPTWFEGHFDATIVPVVTAGVAQFDVRLSGRISSPLLASGASVLVPGGPWFPWLLVLAVGVAIGGTVLVGKARQRRAPQLGVDELVQLADQAASERRFQLALEWQERALQRSPDHPRLLTDAGYFLSELGRVDEAILMLARAAAHGTDGEAELLLARLQASVGNDLEGARRSIAAAIEKDPLNLLEVGSDERFAELLDHDDISPAIRRARRRLEHL